MGPTAARQTVAMFAGAAGETGVARPLDADPAHSYNSRLATCFTPRLPSRPSCLSTKTDVSFGFGFAVANPSHRRSPVISRSSTVNYANQQPSPDAISTMSSPSYVTVSSVGAAYCSALSSNGSTSFCRDVRCQTSTSTAQQPSAVVVRCLLYTSPSPRDRTRSRMPSSA